MSSGWKRGRARCKKIWQSTMVAVREGPCVLVITAAVFLVLLAVGLACVLTASAVSVRNSKDLAERGLGNQVALALKEAMLIATFGSELLATVVKRQPQCDSLEAQWGDIAEDVMGKVNPDVVKQLELDPAGVIWKTSPPLQGHTAEILYGRDLFKEPDDRPGMIYVLQERRTLLVGPYNCRDGFKCAFVVTPIFMTVPGESYDWGCGYQPYNCTDLCWNATTRVKFWGQVSTMLNFDQLLTGQEARLRVLEERGYRYKLWQAATSVSNPYFVLGGTPQPPRDSVRLTISSYNVVWYLELSPTGGWVAPWRDPCLAAVVVGSLAVSLLVLWLLVSKEQHNRLLRAMLPRKVIKQLQAGETPVAQEYDMVTVLFSDIVGYTGVASQLVPRQVVTLLNELFSVFDELTQRNGVYKVETIGDALMCVAGCPTPCDPVESAVRMARMALDMVAAVSEFRPSLEGVRVQIRVGVHSGPVVAGVVGKKMPRYCLFGDTVNTSSRMESTSEPMKIQVSPMTAALLRASGREYELEPRGPVSVKGKGIMETFWLSTRPDQLPLPRSGSFLAALQRPPSLVVRPAPPPPATKPATKRLALRAMTCPEPRNHPLRNQTALSPALALAGLAGTATGAAADSATGVAGSAAAYTGPIVAVPAEDFPGTASTSLSIDSPPMRGRLEDVEKQQQQRAQRPRVQEQQQPAQGAAGQQQQPSDPSPAQDSSAGSFPPGVNGLPSRTSLGGSSASLCDAPALTTGVGAAGAGPGADTRPGSVCGKGPLATYTDGDGDAPLETCSSTLTMRTAMGLSSPVMAAVTAEAGYCSASAVSISDRLLLSPLPAHPPAQPPPLRGAASLSRMHCGMVAPAAEAASPPPGAARRLGTSGGAAAAGQPSSRLRALAMRLPLRRNPAPLRLVDATRWAATEPPSQSGSAPVSAPAAAACAATAAAPASSAHPDSVFRLVSRERSSLGCGAFMALVGSGGSADSDPAVGSGGGGSGGGGAAEGGGARHALPLFALALESNPRLQVELWERP